MMRATCYLIEYSTLQNYAIRVEKIERGSKK